MGPGSPAPTLPGGCSALCQLEPASWGLGRGRSLVHDWPCWLTLLLPQEKTSSGPMPLQGPTPTPLLPTGHPPPPPRGIFKNFLSLKKIKIIFHNSYAQQTQPGSWRDIAVFALCLMPFPLSGTPHPSLSTHSQCPVHISGLPDMPDPTVSSEVYVTAVSPQLRNLLHPFTHLSKASLMLPSTPCFPGVWPTVQSVPMLALFSLPSTTSWLLPLY